MREHLGMSRSRKLFEQARQIMPGGVNSPVRAFGSVGGEPVFFERGEGAYLWDADGNRYVDYVGSWGPAILGHAHPDVVEAVCAAARRGLTFGAPTEGETLLAEKLCSALPSIEKVRLVSSGTEACMSALRLARAFTGRDKIIKFEGCYHGHADMLLVKAGSGALTLGLPDSPGVPAEATKHTLVASFNDLGGLKTLLEQNKGQVAAVILEPIVGNSGFIRPAPGFLKGVRRACSEHGVVLIFDEVMTGFRAAWGGVQILEDIKPDLTTLAKVIGGGMPIGAYGGHADIMAMVAPEGPVYQAGTLSGNPVAVACGLATLEVLERPGSYQKLSSLAERLINGFSHLAHKHKIPFIGDKEGGMFGFFFRGEPVSSHAQAKAADLRAFKSFFHGMLKRGVYLAPSSFEAGFVSLAHTQEDIDFTLSCADEAFSELD